MRISFYCTISVIFPTACVHFVSMSHFGNSWNIPCFFILIIFVLEICAVTIVIVFKCNKSCPFKMENLIDKCGVCSRASHVALVVKNSPANAGDIRDMGSGFNSWVGKIPWRRAWQPLQNSCLENSMDRGTWWAIVYRVVKSQTWLNVCVLSAPPSGAFPHFSPLLCLPLPWDTTMLKLG